MTTLTTSSVDALARHQASPCVSIILPIDRAHPDDRRDHLVLKSLVATVRAQLETTDTAGIDELLRPTAAVLQRTVLSERSGGLALFLAPGFAQELAVDVPVEALATTGSQFTIGPLLPGIESFPPCYVLTVGAENVSLFRLHRTMWSVCDVPDLPAAVEDALFFERDERMSSSHAGGPVGGAGLSIIGHGSGAQDEDRKDRLSRFFQKVDDAVVQFLHNDPETPLVVAGTEPTVARFQHVTRHHRVIPAPVGSPGELLTPELHRRVEKLIEPILAESDDVLFDRLSERLGTGLASVDLGELIHVAAAGRVSDLLVASSTPRWCRPTPPAERLDQWEPGATDLVNDVIVQAWRHDARMHCVPPERLPDGAPLAALLRY
jgi:hypothetical protein